MSQIGLFLRIYTRPGRAFGPIIDEARLAFAVGIALLAIVVVHVPRYSEYQANVSKAMQYLRDHPELRAAMKRPGGTRNPQGSAVQPPSQPQAQSSAVSGPATPSSSAQTASGKPSAPDASDEDDEDAGEPASALSMPMGYAVEQFIGFAPFHYLPPIFSLALCFVPAAILVVTLWQGGGRFSNALFRDYLTLLVCGLMAWAAAYIPLGIINFALSYVHPAWHNAPLLWWAANLYFLVLTMFAIRTLMGATLLHGAGAVAGAWIAGVAGVGMHSVVGSFTWYLASPCVLYYLWANVQGPLHSISYGLSARQRMKRNLETLTINPRDADAHCQLGQIYFQRRQFEPAAERFRKASEIDPAEAEPWYYLGQIARLQGRYDEALTHCQTAVRLDDKHSGSEVWRELGAVQFLAGRHDAARYALEQFIQRREYDPEGQVWYGRVLAAVGDRDAARQAFQNAIEAARTMPAPRKYQVRVWAAEANKELRALPSSPGKGQQTADTGLRPTRLSPQDQ